MTFYELLKRTMPQDGQGRTSVFFTPVCGAISGMAAQTIMYPGDTVRRRMITNGLAGQERVYRNSWDCIMTMVTREGFLSLYKGWGANFARSVPGAAIQFTAYEAFKTTLHV
ncbi:Oxoglutarate/malate translocator protein [Balamuthia mandrillaris]